MGNISLKKQSAVSVPDAAVDQLRVFVDSADSILKTKDSFGNVRPSGVGTADELSTNGAPVDLTAADPPSVGQVLTAESKTSANWQMPQWFSLAAKQSGQVSARIGQVVLMDTTQKDGTVQLPAAPRHGSQIAVKLISVATHPCQICAGGSDQIESSATLELKTDRAWAVLIYDGASRSWMRLG